MESNITWNDCFSAIRREKGKNRWARRGGKGLIRELGLSYALKKMFWFRLVEGIKASWSVRELRVDSRMEPSNPRPAKFSKILHSPVDEEDKTVGVYKNKVD